MQEFGNGFNLAEAKQELAGVLVGNNHFFNRACKKIRLKLASFFNTCKTSNLKLLLCRCR